jgi:hypothetical protein
LREEDYESEGSENLFFLPAPYGQLSAHAYGNAQVFQAGRDLRVFYSPPSFTLTTAPFIRDYLPEHPSWTAQPSQLLRAHFEIVPFSGREVEGEYLRKWRNSRDSKRILIIHGPGGCGKSRLVSHVAKQWMDDGWSAYMAYAQDEKGGSLSQAGFSSAEAPGLLVVADYADRWSPDSLLALLRAVMKVDIPVRVILLARTIETWLETVRYKLIRDFYLDVEDIRLAPLGENPASRGALFVQARDKFAEMLSVFNPEFILPPPSLETDSRYEQVLTIHMAALAKVVAHQQRDVPPQDPEDLTIFLLYRERDYWRALGSRRESPMNTAPEVMAQVVYAATLTGPLEYAEGKGALQCAEIESLAHVRQLIRDHALCYPSGNPSIVLEPLYPDKLGEDFIALTTPGHRSSSFRPDPWAIGALYRLLLYEDSEGIRPPWVSSAQAVLAEVAERWPHMKPFVSVKPAGRHHMRLE